VGTVAFRQVLSLAGRAVTADIDAVRAVFIPELAVFLDGWFIKTVRAAKSSESSARAFASLVKREDRLVVARAVVFEVVSAYWQELQAVSGCRWSLCKLPSDIEIA